MEQNIGKDSASPKIFLVLDITVHDAAMYEQYRIKAESVITKFGGKYLVVPVLWLSIKMRTEKFPL